MLDTCLVYSSLAIHCHVFVTPYYISKLPDITDASITSLLRMTFAPRYLKLLTCSIILFSTVSLHLIGSLTITIAFVFSEIVSYGIVYSEYHPLEIILAVRCRR